MPAGRVISGTPTWRDVDGDSIELVAAADPAHGTLVIAGPELRYTSTAGWTGDESITLRARDQHGLESPPATLTIHVTAAPANSGKGSAAGCGGGVVGLVLLGPLMLLRRRRR